MLERWVTAHSTALAGGTWEITDLEGEEELNGLFRFDVHLVSRDLGAPLPSEADLLEASVMLRFEDRGEVVASVHGIISELRSRALGEHDAVHLWFQLVPRLWLLTQRRASEVFLERSVPEVLAEKLGGIGLKQGDDFVFALQQDYPTREIIVQYDETDYAFFSRLCEHVGIITLFSHEAGRDCLVLTDSQDRFRPILGAGATLHVRSPDRHPAAYDVERTLRRVPADVLVHEYNYRSPRLELRSLARVEKSGSQGTWVQPGEHSKSPGETERVAQIRSAELGLAHQVIRGKTTEMTLHAGGTFVLSDALGHDEELLALRVTHRAHHRAGAPGGEPLERCWDNEFTAIPRATAYRPARRTPKPRVAGLLHAMVDGAIKGPYAELDEAGRYHVRLGYDRSGRTDLGASHPVRMMQPHAGANYGMHFPLRPEAEVLVACVHGDPDRPIIVGAAPNPTVASPVVRSNQTQNVLRTGSNNEIVIEDEIGTERIRIHTPRENTTIQLGAVEEAEYGALVVTDANISEAARLSHNVATDRQIQFGRTGVVLRGDTQVVLVGLPAIAAAADYGIERPAAIDQAALLAELERLGAPPQPADAPPPEPLPPPQAGAGAAGLWSEVGTSASGAAQQAAVQAVRHLAAAADETLARSNGRSQGEPLGDPMTPAAIVGSPETAALFARDRVLVYGDRVATIASWNTVNVAGAEMTQVGSPKTVEVAAGEEIKVTTPGLIDVAAGEQVRLVVGYYPEAEPPPLAEGTSVGVLALQDVRIISQQHCIIGCAHKNVILTAHTGDMHLRAKEQMTLTAGAIAASAGSVTVSAGSVDVDADGNITVKAGGNITVEAGGSVSIKGADVTIEGGAITLKGPVTVEGDLTVTGSIQGG